MKLPQTADELIDELAGMYPARCIHRGEAPEDAHRYAGKRELIEGLLARRAAEEEARPRV